MTPTLINIGAAPNDGTGDPIRTAFQKMNENLAALFAAAPKGAFDATRPPAASDDAAAGYEAGSLWLMPSRGLAWRCLDASLGAAQWAPFGTMDHPGYRPDACYAQNMNATGSANIVANTLYAYPAAFLFRCRVKQLGTFLPTGVAGVTVRLGIYSHDHDTKLPKNLVAEAVADLDMSTNNTPAFGVFADALDLPPDIYWLASCWSGICAPPQVPGAFMGGGMSWMWGGASADGVLGSTASAITTRYTRTAALTYQAGAAFFPAEFGAGSFGQGAPGSPLMAWRTE